MKKQTIILPEYLKPIYEGLAKEELRLQKKPATEENISKLVQEYADEGFWESIHPSDELGKNPESRISKNIVDFTAPAVYGPKGFIRRHTKSDQEYKLARAQFQRIITELSQLYMKLVMNVENKDLAYQSKDKERNYMVTVAQYYRYFATSVIAASLIPLFTLDSRQIHLFMKNFVGLWNTPIKELRKNSKREAFTKAVANTMSNAFSKINILSAFGYRITKEIEGGKNDNNR
jgi:hypothetical protein